MSHIQPNTHLPKDKLYKLYTALLSQSGTNDPTVLMEHHMFGDTTFIWTRTGVGFYLLTSSIPIFGGANTTFTWGWDRAAVITGEQMTASTYRIRNINTDTGANQEGLFRTTVEIKVFS